MADILEREIEALARKDWGEYPEAYPTTTKPVLYPEKR